MQVNRIKVLTRCGVVVASAALVGVFLRAEAHASEAASGQPIVQKEKSSDRKLTFAIEPRYGFAVMNWAEFAREISRLGAGDPQRIVPQFGLAGYGYAKKNFRLGGAFAAAWAPSANDQLKPVPVHYHADLIAVQFGFVGDYVWRRKHWEVDGGLGVGFVNVRSNITELLEREGSYAPNFFADHLAEKTAKTTKWGIGVTPRLGVAYVFEPDIAFAATVDYAVMVVGGGVVHGVSLMVGPQFRFSVAGAAEGDGK